MFLLYQVSSSCTSIYVDGSESRGALSAAIDVSYGSSGSGGSGVGPSKTDRPSATGTKWHYSKTVILKGYSHTRLLCHFILGILCSIMKSSIQLFTQLTVNIQFHLVYVPFIASIRVWTPRTPLSVVVDDQRLSQVRTHFKVLSIIIRMDCLGIPYNLLKLLSDSRMEGGEEDEGEDEQVQE